MNKVLFLFTLTMMIHHTVAAQQLNEKDDALKTVQQFFTALEKQDTVLIKNVLFVEGQSWYVRQDADSTKLGWRSFNSAIKRWVNPQQVIHEKPLPGVEMKIHGQLAMAWVPYELSVNDKFSHCGIDVFTMIKTKAGWKIASLIFTVEPDGCEALMKKN